MFKNIFAALFMLFLCVACDPKDEGSSVILPTGLSTSFIIDEGLVEVQATARGANFYSFMFYDEETLPTLSLTMVLQITRLQQQAHIP